MFPLPIVNVTHSHCHDGTGCTTVLKSIYPDLKVIYFSYGKEEYLANKLAEIDGGTVIFTDISYCPPTDQLSKFFTVFIDHHVTSLRRFLPLPNTLKSANDILSTPVYQEKNEHRMVHIDITKSATSLVNEIFGANFNDSYIQIINAIDLGKFNKELKCMPLVDVIPPTIRWSMTDPIFREMVDKETSHIVGMEKMARSILQHSRTRKISLMGEEIFIKTFPTSSFDHIVCDLCFKEFRLDILVFYNSNAQGVDRKLAIKLRSGHDSVVNVAAIAERYDGGGHIHAAGMMVTAPQLHELFGILV